jgi:hypothetical protein
MDNLLDPVEITPFEFPISTVTGLAAITAEAVDIKDIFWTCHLDYRSDLIQPNGKIAYPGYGGLVLGAKNDNYTRGTIRSDKESFNHSITFLVSTKIKNVTLRFSVTSIHISGAKSYADGYEAVTTLVQRLQPMGLLQQRLISFSDELKDWIYNHLSAISKGPETGEGDHYVMYCDYWPAQLIDVGRYLMSFVYDYEYHSEYLEHIKHLLSLRQPYLYDITVREIQSSMINYIYDLNFPVDNQLMMKYLNNKHGFIVNVEKSSTIVHLPYERMANVLSKEKKGTPHHSFTITKNGFVTQSSPNEEMAADAYYKFRTVMEHLRSIIAPRPTLALIC